MLAQDSPERSSNLIPASNSDLGPLSTKNGSCESRSCESRSCLETNVCLTATCITSTFVTATCHFCGGVFHEICFPHHFHAPLKDVIEIEYRCPRPNHSSSTLQLGVRPLDQFHKMLETQPDSYLNEHAYFKALDEGVVDRSCLGQWVAFIQGTWWKRSSFSSTLSSTISSGYFTNKSDILKNEEFSSLLDLVGICYIVQIGFEIPRVSSFIGEGKKE